ncbi:MAG: ferritin-like domain-containing protein [Myxococcales bacterium]|nr:ferritin-like domain-containing protein [Myxococcales bacterium]
MHWPPYKLATRDYLAQAQKKYSRVERIYHVGQHHSWSGKDVLRDLLRKHGGIDLPPDKRAALREISSTLLWGELAAWSISADLALQLKTVEAKMAATSQTHDEARHFYTLRDYLLELGGELPQLDGYSHTVLTSILDSSCLAEQLLALQLIVENLAVNTFKALQKAQVEPVLAELLSYFERDEARHIGLGVLYLPELLEQLTPLQAFRLQLFQVKVATLIGWGAQLRRPYYEALGIDLNASMRRGMRLHLEVLAGLRSHCETEPRAIFMASAEQQRMNDLSVDLFFPRAGSHQPQWQRVMLGATNAVAAVGERLLA